MQLSTMMYLHREKKNKHIMAMVLLGAFYIYQICNYNPQPKHFMIRGF